MHEAFASQVASNIQALESETWAKEKLGRTEAVGKIDRSRLNVSGGSIAIGHPFGATGARLTTTLANEMKRRSAHARPDLGLRRRGHRLRDGPRAMSAGRALAGVRVVDLTRYIPGPYATMTLADLGADVVKIEPREGDPIRAFPPAVGEESAAHAALNRGKRSVAVDLRTEEGAAVVRKLAGQADVFVEGFRPGVLDKRGLGPAQLLEAHPRLVYCSVTGYGQDGPHAARAGHDIGYGALGGFLGANRDGDGRPVVPATQVIDMTSGLLSVIGILAALQSRERTGRGQHVDVSLLRASLALMTVPLTRALAGPEPGDELTGVYPCYTVYRCRDGKWLAVGRPGAEVLGGRVRRPGPARAGRAPVGAGRGARARARGRGRAVRLARPRRVGARPRRARRLRGARAGLRRDERASDRRGASCSISRSEARALRTVAPPIKLSGRPTGDRPPRARPGRAHGRRARGGRLHARRHREDARRRSPRMTVATPPAASSARAFSQDLTPDGILVLTLDVPGEKVNTLGKGDDGRSC